MAGKQCFGKDYNNAGHFRESNAFCEGLNYRVPSSSFFPDTDNPHEFGSDAYTAWLAGWNLADSNVGTAMPPTGCCAGTTIIGI